MTDVATERNWPANVQELNIGEFMHLGIDRTTHELYWDGQRIVTKHELGQREYFLAQLAAWSTVIATVAAVVSVFADLAGVTGK